MLLEGLREQTSRFGEAAYVITVTADGRPHAVSVTVGWDDDRLTFGAPTFVWHGSTAPTSRLRIYGIRKAWFAPNSPPRGAS